MDSSFIDTSEGITNFTLQKSLNNRSNNLTKNIKHSSSLLFDQNQEMTKNK